MIERKLPFGIRSPRLEGPVVTLEIEKAEHPTATINGVTYTWKPGEEDGVPEEAVAIWQRYLEANP